jgi:hypothetical protein
VSNETEHSGFILRTKAHRVAAIIQQFEVVIPGCFGEAGAVIRKLAAGDDVPPDDLTAAIASVRLTFRDVGVIMDRIPPTELGHS